jgi:hypothetical protein
LGSGVRGANAGVTGRKPAGAAEGGCCVLCVESQEVAWVIARGRCQGWSLCVVHRAAGHNAMPQLYHSTSVASAHQHTRRAPPELLVEEQLLLDGLLAGSHWLGGCLRCWLLPSGHCTGLHLTAGRRAVHRASDTSCKRGQGMQASRLCAENGHAGMVSKERQCMCMLAAASWSVAAQGSASCSAAAARHSTLPRHPTRRTDKGQQFVQQLACACTVAQHKVYKHSAPATSHSRQQAQPRNSRCGGVHLQHCICWLDCLRGCHAGGCGEVTLALHLCRCHLVVIWVVQPKEVLVAAHVPEGRAGDRVS